MVTIPIVNVKGSSYREPGRTSVKWYLTRPAKSFGTSGRTRARQPARGHRTMAYSDRNASARSTDLEGVYSESGGHARCGLDATQSPPYLAWRRVLGLRRSRRREKRHGEEPRGVRQESRKGSGCDEAELALSR